MVNDVYGRCLPIPPGEVATYIPELAKANPDWFGICLVTAGGATYEAGDSRQAFTIQSISKPFVYGLALEDNGRLPVFRGMRLSEDDQLRADLIQALMCHGAIPIDALERRYAIDFGDYFADALRKLAPLAEDGLVRVERHRIVATSRGRLLLRNIAMCFDRYLDSPTAVATPRFSRAI